MASDQEFQSLIAAGRDLNQQQIGILGEWMIEIHKLVIALNRQQQELIQQRQDFIRQLQGFILNRRQEINLVVQQPQIKQRNKYLISEGWSEEVRHYLEATDPDAVPVNGGSVRVSKALVNTKAEAYIPQIMSLGPYHYFSLKDESVGPYHERLTHLSPMEVYKLRSTREAAGNDPRVIQKLFARVIDSDMISKFEQFYNWKIQEEYAPDFAWMMMIDALFLSYFLKSGFDDVRQAESSVTLRRGASKAIAVPAKASIRCDIVKLENQIPLSLLRILEEIVQDTNRLDSLLPSQVNRLSSFQESDIEMPNFNEEHLLGCIHKHVSSFLQVGAEEEESPLTWRQSIWNVVGRLVTGVFRHCYTDPATTGRKDFLDKYSAKDLRKFGVKFQSFKGPGNIRFSRKSGTLYLPQITISDTYTEVLLSNMLALEFNEVGREKRVTHYVELMDCLIESPEDVAFLRESQVIVPQSTVITDDYVARMWDEISKLLSLVGLWEVPGGLKDEIEQVVMKNYYKSQIKNQLSVLHSSPWKVLALLVGILLLLLTALQTFCSVYNCQSGHSSTGTVSKHFRPSG